LAREYFESRAVLGRRRVWGLFDLQDADVNEFAKKANRTARALRGLLRRRLRVVVAEFRFRDLEEQSEASSVAFNRLLKLGAPKSWEEYKTLLQFEDDIAKRAGLPKGSVIVDPPRHPNYADLENLLLPGRRGSEQESPTKVLNYRDWIEAYKAHRAWVRIFGPRGAKEAEAVWKAARAKLAELNMKLPNSTRMYH
jgi:hypothetical protein